MNCFRQAFSCLYPTYAWLFNRGITLEEAEEDLCKENVSWKHPQRHTAHLWHDVQTQKEISKPLTPLVEKALTVLKSRNIQKGIAVDLGCGISPTIFNLLRRGWTVYAVDNSLHILSDLAAKLSDHHTDWFDKNQVVLLNQNIESFELPEKVHLVVATDSLPYCDPKKIKEIFCRIKNALHPQGMVVCNFYSTSSIKPFQQLFYPWTTKKSVVETIMRSAKFSSLKVAEVSKQLHVVAS